jgi:hypothetical protein
MRNNNRTDWDEIIQSVRLFYLVQNIKGKCFFYLLRECVY